MRARWAIAALFAACATHDGGGTVPVEPGEMGPPSFRVVSEALPLAPLAARVHFGFAPSPDGWAGGDVHYGSRVNDKGVIAVRPYDARAPQAAPLVIETVEIARGAYLRTGAGQVSQALDGSLVIDRREAAETVTNQAGGVAHTWRFDEAPPGSGDLALRLRVAGQRYSGRDGETLVFVDPVSGFETRYASPGWIDALGDRTQVLMHYDDAGGVLLRVGEALLDETRFPASLATMIVPRAPAERPLAQSAPAVAAGSEQHLVVWTDARGGENTVHAARVTPAGRILDEDALALGRGSCETPAVAAGEGGFLVVWQERDGRGSIRAQRVDAGGVLLGEPVAVEDGAYGQSPRVAYRDGRWLVAYIDASRGGGDVVARFVDALGASDPIVLSSSRAADRVPALAAGEDGFVVTWMSDLGGGSQAVLAHALDGDGNLLSPVVELGVAGGTQPRVAAGAGPGGYLVAWDEGESAQAAIRAVRVSVFGSVLDASPVDVALSRIVAPRFPVVTHDGSAYQVSWQGARSEGGAIYTNWISHSTGALLAAQATGLTPLAPVSTSPPAATAPGTGATFIVYLHGELGARLVARDGFPSGSLCGSDGDCRSGFCTDQVCCSDRCDGDCATCAVSSGGMLDGTCGPVPFCEPGG